MLNKLTLRDRIFYISSALILLAVVLIWLFVRPEYQRTIVNERTTIDSQLQEYTLRQTDNTISNWLNAVNRLSEDLINNPSETESLSEKAVNYTPGLMRILITDISTNQNIDITRTIYNSVEFNSVKTQWYPSKVDDHINISWMGDSTQTASIFVAKKNLQISEEVFTITVYFNSQSLSNNLTYIPLGGKYEASIVTATSESIFAENSFPFPKELVGEATYSSQKVVSFDNANWYILSSRFETIPFWHIIAVEDSFILEPVHQLIRFAFISAGIILLLMFIFSWYVSVRINNPVQSILTDVEHLGKLDFEHPIKSVSLPEFKTMHNTLEDIRITLKRYKKINVEKLILEEWKNRYMVTYSKDLIGVVGENNKFSFANNQLTHFLESLELNPVECSLNDVIEHKDLIFSRSKASKSYHYPNPFTVMVDQADIEHLHDNGTNYYYVSQQLSILNEDSKVIGSYLIIHDKTEDRLLDIKRNDMINVIVHELKNPISAVVGISKLIIDNKSMDEDEIIMLLKEIYNSGERMNDLVNRFLEIQKLEIGSTGLDFAEVNMLQLVKDVKMISNPLLIDKHLNLKIDVKGNEFNIIASKVFAFDAIQDLVSNAVKYGDPNRTIVIEVASTLSKVTVSVTDYGYGISEEDQKKVFDKFFRIKSNVKAAKEKGTGLGLTYVKEIMVRHKGEIILESNPDIGSKFTLVFPKKRAEINI